LYVPPIIGAWDSLEHLSRGCDEIQRMYRKLESSINTLLSAITRMNSSSKNTVSGTVRKMSEGIGKGILNSDTTCLVII